MPEIQKPADDPQGEAAGDPAAGGNPPESEPKTVTLTQEALDKMIADRLKRAKPDDYDELVAMKARLDAEEEAKKTEAQKAEDERKERERKVNEKNSKANAKLIRAEVIAEASAQNAIDADLVAQLLAGSKDIKVDDEGEVIGAKEAVASLLMDKPVLVKGKTPGSSGGEFGGNDPKTVNAKIAELERQMNDPKLTLSERQNAGREARALKLGTISQ